MAQPEEKRDENTPIAVLERKLKGHASWVNSVAVSPNSTWAVLPLLAWPIAGHFSFKRLILSVKGESVEGGSVSISKTQIVIWTVVVLFGIIYVYRISEGFLDITPQILLLLGIGGGTAVKRGQSKNSKRSLMRRSKRIFF